MIKFIFLCALIFSSLSTNVLAQIKQQIPTVESGSKVKADRLIILNDELKDSIEMLAKVMDKEPKNEIKIHRIREDIRVLNLEIERAKKEKIVEVDWKQKDVKTAANVSQEAVEKNQERIYKFESWDVFKNFGKKEN